MRHTAFIAGATGYMGRRLAAELIARGHAVHALARSGSENKVPTGCLVVRGNALDAASYRDQAAGADTFVHLVGAAHPAPWKGREFTEIDLPSLIESVSAARSAGIEHFVYVSVAHPAPVMKSYIRVRERCEDILSGSGLRTTILRPWYVLGPGHRWPVVLRPLYWLGERIPATREGALRLGLVTLDQMTGALVRAIENPAGSQRVIPVQEVRRFAAAM